MGFPAIQLVFIAARQLTKPITLKFMEYGKQHPVFRNNFLIPIGKRIVHMKTNFSMRSLGLGKPTSYAPVSEVQALEQAAELTQEVLVYCSTAGSAYLLWWITTKISTPPAKKDEFDLLKARVEYIEQRLGIEPPVIVVEPKVEDHSQFGQLTKLLAGESRNTSVAPQIETATSSANPPSASSTEKTSTKPNSPPPQPVVSGKTLTTNSKTTVTRDLPVESRRISSLPVDSAVRVILPGSKKALPDR